MRLSAVVHERVATALRSAVAGPDGERVRSRIWDTPGPRWFSPDDPLWRVHSDASMFVGGLASLLLQSLHPAAMAGVAQHSGYRSDPWGRLQRTSHYIATTSFATIEHAEAMIGAVREIHNRINGVHDGVAYAAGDPHLLEWVHAAETSCFLAAHDVFGAEPLTGAERDVYVTQAALSAQLLGARSLPHSVAQLHGTLESYRPELRATPACLDARRFLLDDPPLPAVARPGYALLTRGAISLLPVWARTQLELSGRPLDRSRGRFGTRAIRWAMTG